MTSLQPRDYLTTGSRKYFGRRRDVTWRVNDPDVRTVRGQVARHQARAHHEMARYARDRRGTMGWHSWQEVADNTPIEVDGPQLRAIMRGEATLTMHHIAALEVALGQPLLLPGHRMRAQQQRA